ncbi:MAG: hypothetical protein DRI57_12175 [Deltaproteobacteria bacterium]|nr:MAG: hypothetical protein DRI57_12175 [Deltaproteobacteria bacterium]
MRPLRGEIFALRGRYETARGQRGTTPGELTYYKNHSLRGTHKNAFPQIRYNQKYMDIQKNNSWSHRSEMYACTIFSRLPCDIDECFNRCQIS